MILKNLKCEQLNSVLNCFIFRFKQPTYNTNKFNICNINYNSNITKNLYLRNAIILERHLKNNNDYKLLLRLCSILNAKAINNSIKFNSFWNNLDIILFNYFKSNNSDLEYKVKYFVSYKLYTFNNLINNASTYNICFNNFAILKKIDETLDIDNSKNHLFYKIQVLFYYKYFMSLNNNNSELISNNYLNYLIDENTKIIGLKPNELLYLSLIFFYANINYIYHDKSKINDNKLIIDNFLSFRNSKAKVNYNKQFDINQFNIFGKNNIIKFIDIIFINKIKEEKLFNFLNNSIYQYILCMYDMHILYNISKNIYFFLENTKSNMQLLHLLNNIKFIKHLEALYNTNVLSVYHLNIKQQLYYIKLCIYYLKLYIYNTSNYLLLNEDLEILNKLCVKLIDNAYVIYNLYNNNNNNNTLTKSNKIVLIDFTAKYLIVLKYYIYSNNYKNIIEKLKIYDEKVPFKLNSILNIFNLYIVEIKENNYNDINSKNKFKNNKIQKQIKYLKKKLNYIIKMLK